MSECPMCSGDTGSESKLVEVDTGWEGVHCVHRDSDLTPRAHVCEDCACRVIRLINDVDG